MITVEYYINLCNLIPVLKDNYRMIYVTLRFVIVKSITLHCDTWFAGIHVHSFGFQNVVVE